MLSSKLCIAKHALKHHLDLICIYRRNGAIGTAMSLSVIGRDPNAA